MIRDYQRASSLGNLLVLRYPPAKDLYGHTSFPL
jgi:hypothetical protein